MTAINDAYINALLADASYVDLNDEPLNTAIRRTKVRPKKLLIGCALAHRMQ